MAKRKITVTVDEDILAAVEAFGIDNLSSTVNAALAAEVDSVGRRLALGELLAGWDTAYGRVSETSLALARESFAELDTPSTIRGISHVA